MKFFKLSNWRFETKLSKFITKFAYIGIDPILKNSKIVDYLYLPTSSQIYKKKSNKKIKISALGKKLCGKFKPGHFESVVDVIDRFIKIIKPNKICLGEKDMQQLKIIEEYIFRNNIKTKVVSCKIVREKNGLAYSSRNSLLTNHEKAIASKIYKLLLKEKKNIIKKKNFY